MMRILFVDDEQQILDGLRALLRPKRHVWETVFVTSGADALAALGQAHFDVIVSDMKMPGMDGATLLRHVQARHPGVVRIVLSGHAELESALRTVPVAHQFLLKPCDPQVLECVVQRACDLQALINNEAIRKFVSGVQSLPALPHVYVQLTALLENENSGVAQIARVIEQDPAMCAKVLQLVNSSFIGLGRTISDVEQAISYLGLTLLKNLTLVVQVFNVRALSEARRLQVHRLQRHGLLVGAIARRMMADNPRLADDAFMAGILHDIGKLVLLDHKPDLFDLVQTKARLARRPMYEIEQEVLGVTHAEIGGFLLGIWGLPYQIVEAAANHHAPGRVHKPSVDVLMAVHVANNLALEQERALGVGEIVQSTLDEDYLAAAGVAGRVEEWREIAVSQIGEARAEYWAEGQENKAA
jgi:HD-like signal output (HDOD) protein